ncbi:MAG: DUF1634 domain-containing protein [Candidatus Methanomethylicaceae archaeon]
MVSAETTISWVLRVGVLLSALFMIVGLFFGEGLVWLGVSLLILTPFLRVFIAALYFLSHKDLRFFVITLYVILILVIGSLLKF